MADVLCVVQPVLAFQPTFPRPAAAPPCAGKRRSAFVQRPRSLACFYRTMLRHLCCDAAVTVRQSWRKASREGMALDDTMACQTTEKTPCQRNMEALRPKAVQSGEQCRMVRPTLYHLIKPRQPLLSETRLRHRPCQVAVPLNNSPKLPLHEER